MSEYCFLRHVSSIKKDKVIRNENVTVPILDFNENSDEECAEQDVVTTNAKDDQSKPNTNERNFDSEKVLKNSITVACPRMNESAYRGTINYTEAKEKIFQKGHGLTPCLLSALRMLFKNHPINIYKL